MTHAEATRLLGMAQDGQPLPPEVLSEALFLTGDNEPPTALPCPDIEEFLQALRQAGAL